MYSVAKGKGWFNEPYRHSLAAKGIRTKLHGRIITRTQHGIPITIKEKPEKGRQYPVTPVEVKKRLDALPADMVDGITEINFRNPGPPVTKQDKAWAQYHRTEKRLNIFSQPKNQISRAVRNYYMAYVVPHEVSHHFLQNNLKLNKDPVLIEEARADALAYGYNPFNQKVLKNFIERRKQMFGPRGTI